MNDFDNKQICLYKDIDRFGFTCDVCGRKVNGCHYINGMSFCEKCYQETFGKDNQQNEIQLLKQLVEKQNKIDEISKEFVQAVHAVYDWRVLCAEKDKEIETMKKDSDKNIDYLVEFASLIENEKDCNRMLKALDRVKSGNKYIIDKANQSKTEFAIQELEKVKSSLFSKAIQITGTGVDCVRLYEINKIINQQIKELKGE